MIGRRLRILLLHILVVCSFAGIIAEVLDWYNPFMNFSGNLVFVRVILYAGVILLAATREKQKKHIARE